MINRSIVFWLCSIHTAAVSINKLSMILVRFVTFYIFDSKHYSSCLCILSLCFFSYDWISILGYSNQEGGTINMLYSIKRICHMTPLPPCNGRVHLHSSHFLLSPRWPCIVERFGCIFESLPSNWVIDNALVNQFLPWLCNVTWHIKMMLNCFNHSRT